MIRETTSLFYPEAKITLGNYTFSNGVEITVHSAQDTYYDWAKVQLSQAFDGLQISKGEEAEIYLGYDGKLQRVFTGYVYKQGDTGVLQLRDDMLKLEALKLSHTFVDADPADIVEYCLAQAGVTNYKLFKDRHQRRKLVPITLKNGIQVFEDVKRLWGIKDLFYFADGIFYFGRQPNQENVYTFEYGNNIISLAPEAGGWCLETASVPFVRHSDIINIVHPKTSGKRVVKKVVFNSGFGFMRTKLYF